MRPNRGAPGRVRAGTVVDAVFGEEVEVWLRPRDGRVVAAKTYHPLPSPPTFVGKEEARERWGIG